MTSSTGARLPASESLARCLSLASGRAGEPLTVVDVLQTVFDADNERWPDVLVRIEATHFDFPGVRERERKGEPVERTDMPHSDYVAVSAVFGDVFERAWRVAAWLHAEYVAPVHFVLAAVLDSSASTSALMANATIESVLDAIGDIILSTDITHLLALRASRPIDEQARRSSVGASAQVPSDRRELVGRIDEMLDRPTPRGRAAAHLVVGVAIVVGALVGTAIVAQWKIPFVATPAERATNAGIELVRQGQVDEGIRSFAKALDGAPYYQPALEAETCALWSVGYRDDSLFYLQRLLSAAHVDDFPNRTRASGSAPCVLDAPGQSGLLILRTGAGPVLITGPAHDDGRRLLDELAATPPSRTGWRELLAATCVNVAANLDRLGAYQLTLAFASREVTAVTGSLLICVKETLPAHFGVVKAKTGEFYVANDQAGRIYVPGRSPVPPPTTIALPPR